VPLPPVLLPQAPSSAQLKVKMASGALEIGTAPERRILTIRMRFTSLAHKQHSCQAVALGIFGYCAAKSGHGCRTLCQGGPSR
jgi:hypothetical protein